MLATAGADGIVYGLGAIKGVGEAASDALLAARDADGPFVDLWDFCRRVDLRKVNKRVIEALIRAGALDEWGANRATLANQLPAALKLAEQRQTSVTAGQDDLFGVAGGGQLAPSCATPVSLAAAPIVTRTWPEWDEDERLQGEKDTLGFYLTGHPLDAYEEELAAMQVQRIGTLLASAASAGGTQHTVVGLAVAVRANKTPRGRMASVLLDDRTGRIEATVFTELYESVREKLINDELLVVGGSLSFDQFRDRWSLRANSVRSLTETRLEMARHLSLRLDLRDPARHAQGVETVATLSAVLTEFRAERGVPVRIFYLRPGASGRLNLGARWRVTPSDALLKRLRTVLGRTAVEVMYRREPPIAEAHRRPRLAAVR